MLLTAQVSQSERFEKLAESLKELEEAQRDTRQRLDVLTLTVDDLIRGRADVTNARYTAIMADEQRQMWKPNESQTAARHAAPIRG